MSAMTEKDIATRSDVEAELWRWSGWKADQHSVDALLAVVDRYAHGEPVHDLEPEPPESPPADLVAVPWHTLPIRSFRDPDGLVWVCLGAVPTAPVERTRKCTGCGAVKRLDRYKLDPASRGGRKTRCRDCENLRRRQYLAGSGEKP